MSAVSGALRFVDDTGKEVAKVPTSMADASRIFHLMVEGRLGMEFTQGRQVSITYRPISKDAAAPSDKGEEESLSEPSPLESDIDKLADRIVAGLRKLEGDYRHTTGDHQEWALGGATVTDLDLDADEERTLRSRIRRARLKAFKTIENEVGGEFVKDGKEGKQWKWRLERPEAGVPPTPSSQDDLLSSSERDEKKEVAAQSSH